MIAAAAANANHGLGFDVIITSGTDGKHMVGSKHYVGQALDFRTKYEGVDQTVVDLWIKRFSDRLGPDYQVIREVDHLHVEWDSKP